MNIKKEYKHKNLNQMKILKLSFLSAILFFVFAAIATNKTKVPKEVKISKTELLNKIKGGWAGQTIGVTFGGPAEFKYKGTFIKDYTPLRWTEDMPKWYYDNAPGLYDDIYMDLTFVDIFEKHGLDAPVEKFALAFANADYFLWHANQAARYNILNGIMPPESGHWKNNMHADDIDFQIEADFAGLMSPGMVNTSTEICDKIGHIMNYGDGWYAGVYVAAMYSLAFVSDDVQFVVEEALNTIPAESKYYQCMKDVIGFHKKFPNDWKRAWFEIESSDWAQDLHCPDGIFQAFNIDATVNSAYVLMGLLYGEGDFAKSLDVSTRCGQDADCNPATVGGILGVMMGYDAIPAYWLDPLKVVEDRDFKYTTISLNKVYDLSYKHAIELIKRNGGKVEGDKVTIKVQEPKPAPLEVAFPNIYPVDMVPIRKSIDGINELNFEGTGIVIRGKVDGKETHKNYVAEIEFVIDDNIRRVMKLPADFIKRNEQLYWNVELQKGEHSLKAKWLNPEKGVTVRVQDYIVFSDKLKKHN